MNPSFFMLDELIKISQAGTPLGALINEEKPQYPTANVGGVAKRQNRLSDQARVTSSSPDPEARTPAAGPDEAGTTSDY